MGLHWEMSSLMIRFSDLANEVSSFGEVLGV